MITEKHKQLLATAQEVPENSGYDSAFVIMLPATGSASFPTAQILILYDEMIKLGLLSRSPNNWDYDLTNKGIKEMEDYLVHKCLEEALNGVFRDSPIEMFAIMKHEDNGNLPTMENGLKVFPTFDSAQEQWFRCSNRESFGVYRVFVTVANRVKTN